MELNTSPNLTTAAKVLALIGEARNAETFREVSKLQEILQPCWNDIETDPNYENYDLPIEAELLRLSGAFLTMYASSRGLQNFHLRAKNLLTRAIEKFERLGLPEKVAEANLWLGFAYGNCGENEEYQLIYDAIESEFAATSASHRIRLLVVINRIALCIYKNNRIEAEKLIEENAVFFESSADLRLQTMFHNNAGIILMFGGNYRAAGYHFNRSAVLAKALKISDFEARIQNNLAHLYKEQENFKESHAAARRAEELFLSAGNTAGIPIVLDTKALIYLAEKKAEKALQTVETALDYFFQGEDFNVLTDALWTKTLCLLRLDRIEEALVIYGRLHQIAAERIGETAVKKFARLLADEIYVPQAGSLPEEVRRFQKDRVKRGLLKNGLRLVKTAKHLGLGNHENLRNILKKNPEIYQELKMSSPKKRNAKKRQAPAQPPDNRRTPVNDDFLRDGFIRKDTLPGARTVVLRPEDILEEKVIAKVRFQNAIFAFDYDFDVEHLDAFYFDENLMSNFGVLSDAVVAVAPLASMKTGLMVLIQHETRFLLGRIEHSALEDIYYLDDENFGWIPLDAGNVVGVPVGYCPMTEADSKLIAFKKLTV